MKKLIKLQIRNLFHNKLFYICLILSLLMCYTSIFLSSLFAEGNKAMNQIVSLLQGGIDIIDIVFVVLFCCYDFNDGTTKNIIARGYTKNQLLFSKYIVSIIGVSVIYLIMILLTFTLTIKNGIGYESNMILIIINSIIAIITYIIFYSTISFLLEKNGISLIVCLFVPSIISSLLGLVDLKFNINISKYWIDNISNTFIPTPTLSNLTTSIIQYLIYIIIFIVIGTQLLKKKEIK